MATSSGSSASTVSRTVPTKGKATGTRRPIRSPRTSTWITGTPSGRNGRYGKSVPSMTSASQCSMARYPEENPISPVIPTSYGLSYSTNSLPRNACTTGAFNAPASAISCECAPAHPAPAKIVTALASFSAEAASTSAASLGRTIGDAARIGTGSPALRASSRNVPPGTTTTATPPRASAARIATCRIRGSCSWVLISSQYTLHSRNSSCGWVSWKYSPPISSAGMCAAMASTGTALRLASNRPLIRCRLPGPQLAAHTASSPVSAASAAAANPAASSCRTCSQAMVPSRRSASVNPFSESPGIPYTRCTPDAFSVATITSATVVAISSP